MSLLPDHDAEGPGNAGYEKGEVNVRRIVFFAGVSIVVVVALLIFSLDYFGAVKEELVQELVLEPQSAALRELRAREIEDLSSYQLLDSAAGLYRIPIRRAMELVADEAYHRQDAVEGEK